VSKTFTVSLGPNVIIDPADGSIAYTNQDSIEVTFDITDPAPLTTANMSHYVNGVLVDHGSNDDLDGETSVQGYSSSFELQVGVNVFYFTVNDTAGNSVTVRVVIVYSTGPSVIIDPTDGSTTYNKTGSVTVSGTLTDYAPLSDGNWTHYLDGIEIGHGAMSDLGDWQASYVDGVYTYSGSQHWSLLEGTNVLSMTFNDTAGNSVTETITVIYSTGPVITTDPASPIYTDRDEITVTIDMTGHAPFTTGSIAYYVNGTFVSEETIGDIGGLFTYHQNPLLILEPGLNEWRLTVSDAAGNTATYILTVYYDIIAPSIVISSPGDDSYNSTGSVTVTWSGQDNEFGSGIAYYNLSVYNGAVWQNYSHLAPTVLSKLLSLNDGSYTAYVEAVDNAGNVNMTHVSFVVDTVEPSVTIDYPSDNSYNTTGSVTVSWTADDDGSGIDKIEASTDGITWTLVIGTQYPMPSLDDGSYTVYVKVTDKAGNVNETQVTFVVDTIEPTVTAASPTEDDVPVDAGIVIIFSEAMNHTSVHVLLNGAEVVLTWNGNASSFNPTSDLDYNTEYTVTVTGKDLAGNALQQLSWTFTTMKNEGVIEGTIKDKDGTPIVGATVMLSNNMTTTTDENGHFRFTNVTTGSYTLTVEKDGYETFTRDVSTTAGGTSEMGTLSVEAKPAADNTALLIGMVVVIVAIAAIGGFLFMRRKK
jgi:hypothetical protein